MYINVYLTMVRKQIYITEDQDKALKQIKDSMGVPEAESVRRAIDEYLKNLTQN